MQCKEFIRPIDKQPYDCTTFVLEVLTVYGNELRLFWPRHSLFSNYICRVPDIAAVGTIFNVFSFDSVLDCDLNLAHPQRKRKLSVQTFQPLIVIYRRVMVIFCIIVDEHQFIGHCLIPLYVVEIVNLRQ